MGVGCGVWRGEKQQCYFETTNPVCQHAAITDLTIHATRTAYFIADRSLTEAGWCMYAFITEQTTSTTAAMMKHVTRKSL